MSAKKNKFGTITIYCDYCSDFFDTNEDFPSDAWKEAKKAGWKGVYPNTYDGEYTNYCPECWEHKKNQEL